MKAKEWLDCDSCPVDEMVWVAVEELRDVRVYVGLGYKASFNGHWKDIDGLDFQYQKKAVLGWLPMNKPTYEKEGE